MFKKQLIVSLLIPLLITFPVQAKNVQEDQNVVKLPKLKTIFSDNLSKTLIGSNKRYINNQSLLSGPVDPREKILRDYLAQFNSPLKDSAKDFIEAADTYGVDWKLVPAIAGVESTFGKFTPGNAQYPSYNGWGWGVYGNQALYFKSWRDAIFTINKGLKENYIDKGYTDPYSMNRKYAASTAWGGKVAYFMNDIEKFEKNHPAQASKPVIESFDLGMTTSAQVEN